MLDLTKQLVFLLLTISLGWLFLSCSEDKIVSIEKEKGSIVGVVHPKEARATVKAMQAVEIRRAVTDEEGLFRIDSLTVGVYDLEITPRALARNRCPGWWFSMAALLRREKST
ncbi:MAG: hypothetical protein ACE5HO_08650 [bacterium]